MTRSKKGAVAELRERALHALGSGRLGADDLLELALRSPVIRRELGTKLDEVALDLERRMRVAPVLHPEDPPLTEVLEAARAHFAQHPDVMSVGWGRAYKAGAPRDAVGLVVRVRSKGDVVGDRAIHSPIELEIGGQRRSFIVDVQKQRRLHKQSGLRPGDFGGLVSEGGTGTLSACLELEDQTHVGFLSGHVAKRNGASVRARATTGDHFELGPVVWQVENSRLDAAAVRGMTNASVVALAGTTASVATIDQSLVDVAVWVRGAASGQERKAFIRDVARDVDWGSGTMHDLIALDRTASADGDSGAPVVDSLGRLIGFVVGVDEDGLTHLLPARKVIDAFPQ